ncbi:hypothetical protein WA158_004835 [Blastocystis sp. Blastoise]
MPFYRLFVIARNDLPKSSIMSLFENSVNTVTKSGGVFQKLTNLGEKQLQYPIHCKDPQKIYRQGNHYIMEFCSNPLALEKVTFDLKESRQCLRIEKEKLRPEYGMKL